jgi:hypothetical protein
VSAATALWGLQKQKTAEQTSSMIRASGFVPLPFNLDKVALTYFYKKGKDMFRFSKIWL